MDLVEKLEKDEVLMSNKLAMQGLADMKLLLDYLDIYNVADKVILFISIAQCSSCVFCFVLGFSSILS